MASRVRLLTVFVSLVLLALGWQLVGYDFNNIAPIEKVEIAGKFENLSPVHLRQQVVSVIDGGYFTLDLRKMKTSLLALPWVDAVSVRRQWPSALHITVKEKRAAAYWNDDAMISDSGDLFKPEVINRQLQLPKLNGPEGLHRKVWEFLSTLNTKLESAGVNVLELDLDERRAWSFNFLAKNSSEKIEVRLGRSNVAHRLDRFVQVFAGIETFDFNSIETIDLRYPNGFAMRMKNNITSKHALVREV